jgi:hypothetical protein
MVFSFWVVVGGAAALAGRRQNGKNSTTNGEFARPVGEKNSS